MLRTSLLKEADARTYFTSDHRFNDDRIQFVLFCYPVRRLLMTCTDVSPFRITRFRLEIHPVFPHPG